MIYTGSNVPGEYNLIPLRSLSDLRIPIERGTRL